MIWTALILLLVFSAGFAFWPLFLSKNTAVNPEDHDLSVYKAQLMELEAERDQGLIAEDAFKAAQLEIQRRILRLSGTGTPQKNVATGLFMPFAAVVIVLLGAGLFYFERGAPSLPGTNAQSLSTPPVQPGEPSMEELLAKLRAQLQETPDNQQGWQLMARSLATLDRHGEAAVAYGTLAALDPDNPDWLVEKAEALVRMGDGAVSPAAMLAFEQAAARAPNHPAPPFYQGLAFFQAGNIEAAHETWTDLAARSDPDAPWMAPLKAQIALAKQRLGLPVLDEETIEAAANMSTEERQAFIESMVERLATRLEENPDDLDGWLRLARARMTLGQNEAAIAALKQAESLATGSLAEQIKSDIAALADRR